ncbi:MAG: 23S rRNA (guanosine(2251)-2'-O)-methyltransferase RlmB [Ferrimicrobium sp.]|uniref:23S rRNA (guanosine(2251)-2'-O)-methyltransferase RlmB n=1 Tax=Ferrimicrobium sp. TaxID=2926050 RepID=UPI002604FC2E|nr:23S rRNA (guanosine(2251)-2'-O)-methyltransferase RlmB [Ferrimicrobium sp.]
MSERNVGGTQVEGRRAVLELLRARRRLVQEVWCQRRAVDEEIVQVAASVGVRVREVSESTFRERASSFQPQGVLAIAEPLRSRALDELVGADALLLVLDRIQDPQNLGAMLRSAAGAGVSGVILPERRGALVTPAVTKVASGAVEYLDFAVVAGIPNALAFLQKHGVWTVGLAAEADTVLAESNLLTEPLALVVGAEGDGLARLTRQRCDLLVKIPMAPSVASLNASAATAVALFTIAGARRGG